MIKKKRNKNLEKRLQIWLLGAVSVFALMFGSGSFLKEKLFYTTQLSTDSLQNLKDLNDKYDFSVDKKLVGGDANLVAELSTANVLESSTEDYKGLIVSMDESLTKGGLILLKPGHEIPVSALEDIADEYMSLIPEFESVEVDQDVQFEGYAVYGIDYEKSSPAPAPKVAVQLSSEVDLSPVKIAVIDSGIDTAHDVFKNITLETGWNTIDNNATMYDDVGHGTHMAGIIALNAPNSIIIPYKIAGAKGGELSNVLTAYQMAIDNGALVINSSFGVVNDSYSLKKLVKKAQKKGIVIVAAAGNNSAEGPFYPAEYSESIAIASVDLLGQKMPKSNYGYWIDLASLGDKVSSAVPGNTYAYKSGTSPATAYVSAKIGVLLGSSGQMTSKKIVTYLQSSASSKISTGVLAGVSIVK
ncbi:MAG: S8 family serine peptidase [Patescibacteria group bacterium]